jgi:hypothetical protein
MRAVEATLLGLLGISIAANVVLGVQLHDRSKVTTTDYGIYGSFLSSIHQIQVGLQGTTYQNGEELSKLKAALNSLNSQLPNHP